MSLPPINAALIARQLKTTPYHIRRAIKLESQGVLSQARWGAGRPKSSSPVTQEQEDWLVHRRTLQHHVGCSLRARTEAFKEKFGRSLKMRQLRSIYKRRHVTQQRFAPRLGSPNLGSVEDQARAIAECLDNVMCLFREGYEVIQIDEACFSPKKNDRKHWAPAGHPLEVREKWTSMPQIKVCGAISEESGTSVTLYSYEPFTHRDMITMLFRLRKWYGPDKKLAVFWDNAAYHRSPEVLGVAGDPEVDIKILRNVPYRPDFNGIELMWR